MCIINEILANGTIRGLRMREAEKTKPGRHGRVFLAVLLISLAELLLLLSVWLGVDARSIRFYMNDAAEITVPYGQPYVEPGVRAVSIGRITGENPEELPVHVRGQVDTGTMGDYVLRYVAKTMLHSYSITRLVHVADTTPPQITLLHREAYAPSWLDGYEEEGYTALDDVDGDLTDQVAAETRGNRRIYSVSDRAGNRTELVREIPYSLGCPELRLLGGEIYVQDAGFSFSDPGFTARDARGNDLSALVHCEGEVRPYAAGDYTLHYWIENAKGERVEADRLVTVRPLRNPDTADPEGKRIYLTFDDGPGPYTDRLLDVLGAYNVKATFFVTCRYPDYFGCIGRASREGHSIGVHTASHNYQAIYASEKAFFDDFDSVEALIHAQTGSDSTLCRFPGGSSNTVSRFNRGIMTRLARAVGEKGYQYFDWNVSSGDAGETTSTDQVFENITRGCAGHRVSVVLQHDIKDFSVDAVERVIVWGLTNGYSFAALDETGPLVHHKIAN